MKKSKSEKQEAEFTKTYRSRISGTLRKDFEFYMSSQGMKEGEAIRECIKSHIRKKVTSPDIQIRLRSIEVSLRELVKEIG